MYDQIALALDFDEELQITNLLNKLNPKPKILKLGLQICSNLGTEYIVHKIKEKFPECEIFLDLKLHDIPNTVAKAVNNLQKLPIKYLTVHALGGEKMLKESLNIIKNNLNLVAVTVLTSHSENELKNMGLNDAISLTNSLVHNAYTNGIRWFVCSPNEVSFLKKNYSEIKLIVPGIRLANSQKNDQSRIATPQDAIANGADILVVGRAITNTENPEIIWNELLK